MRSILGKIDFLTREYFMTAPSILKRRIYPCVAVDRADFKPFLDVKSVFSRRASYPCSSSGRADSNGSSCCGAAENVDQTILKQKFNQKS
jgi:hypothetical protein